MNLDLEAFRKLATDAARQARECGLYGHSPCTCGVAHLSAPLLMLCDEVERLTALVNSPEVDDFARGVQLEALHQRERWGSEHDGGKTPADWFWLVGYLAGKALHSVIGGNVEKAKHHLITTAAALCNWHAALLGQTNMRPGIAPPEQHQ